MNTHSRIYVYNINNYIIRESILISIKYLINFTLDKFYI